MRVSAKLTPRETEVAELLAWGAAKKEVANRLFISTRTVENTARSIYEKIGAQKATELCVWWFCTRCGVSFNLSPIKRQLFSIVFLLIMLPQLTNPYDEKMYIHRTSKTKMVRICGARPRRNENDFQLT